MGSDLPTRFRPVGFLYNIHKLILTGGITLNVNDLCHFSSPVEEKKKLKFCFFVNNCVSKKLLLLLLLFFFFFRIL